MIATAPYVYNPSQLWTLGIAAYAALISTFLLGWDAYKWLASGPKVEIDVSDGMRMVGGTEPDPNTYFSITAWNVGDQPTTITNLAGTYYETRWHAYVRRRKPIEAFVITTPSVAQRLPYRFEVGDQWIGMAYQTEDMTKKAKSGYLFFVLYTARGGRGHRVRVKIREETVAH